MFSIGQRIRTGLGGLMFTLIPLVFVVMGIGMTAWSIYREHTYLPVEGTVTAIEGGGVEHDHIRVRYAYYVEGKEYSGEVDAQEDDSEYAELQSLQPGGGLKIWYDPQNPGTSERSVEPTAVPLAFALFAIPFLVLGLNELAVAFRGRPMWTSRSIGQGHPLPGGGQFLVLTGLCCLGAFALALGTKGVRFPLNLVIMLGYALVVIPLVMRLTSWLGRRSKSRRRIRQDADGMAQSAPGGRTADEEDDANDRAAELKALGSLGKKLAIAVGATLFWCGITGVFVGAGILGVVRSFQAGEWPEVTGEVLLSKVKSDRGGDNTTYRPHVRYRYTVGGQEYVRDRYSVMSASSNDYDYASRVVREHPKGRQVTVYYDPDDPGEAVLSRDTPGMAYFILLFMQPFLLVGLWLIVWTITLPRRHARLKRFLGEPTVLPWRIPTWDVLEQEVEGATIRSTGRAGRTIKALAMGHGVTCLLAVFVVAFAVGIGEVTQTTFLAALGAGLGVGVVAATYTCVRRGPGSVVKLDLMRRVLTVSSWRREAEVDLDRLRTWRLRKVRYPGGLVVNNQRVRCLLLEVLTGDGHSVPIHAFSFSREVKAEVMMLIAVRTQRGFADLAGGRCRKSLVTSPDEVASERKSPGGAIGQVRLIARAVLQWWKGDDYSDLM